MSVVSVNSRKRDIVCDQMSPRKLFALQICISWRVASSVILYADSTVRAHETIASTVQPINRLLR
jgi:hypothetical protein